MNTTDKILLILGGVIASAVIVIIIARQQGIATKPTYVVRSYHNLEEWKFIKDENGRVTGVSVRRTAEQS